MSNWQAAEEGDLQDDFDADFDNKNVKLLIVKAIVKYISLECTGKGLYIVHGEL